MTSPAIKGIVKLSSIIVFPIFSSIDSRSMAAALPRNASFGLTKSDAARLAKNIPANVPSRCFRELSEYFLFPKCFPIIWDTESPTASIIIAARAIFSSKSINDSSAPPIYIRVPFPGFSFKSFSLSKFFRNQ